MRGLLTKTLYEVWLPTLLYGLGLFVVKMILTYILPQIHEALGEVLHRLPFARTFLTILLGNTLGAEISARSMQAFLYVHPVVLALVWAHAVTLCTRMPAAEIDRGTIDVLLSLPVSRRAVYACESIVWIVSGAFVLMMGLAGHLVAAPRMPDELRPELPRIVFVLVNLYCVYIAVGGIAFLVSCAERPPRPRSRGGLCHSAGVVPVELHRQLLAAGQTDRVPGHPGILPACADLAARRLSRCAM